MTIWNLFDKAVAEVDSDRQNRINEAYIVKLEARIKELEARPVESLNVERVDMLVRVLNDMPIFRISEGAGRILKIRILRTAFNLGLKEATDAIETGHWTVPVKDDGYDDLPF